MTFAEDVYKRQVYWRCRVELFTAELLLCQAHDYFLFQAFRIAFVSQCEDGDMAVEIIIQIGDREFWKQFDDMKSYMKLSYQIILDELRKVQSE